ncbi:MAG: 4Fe-4S binding protein [Desulfobacteraceae bacterium]|nr:4Fe-4S binding protein [Desulfobacteraceae bacterium]
MQSKKSFAAVNYEICNPGKCNPEEGRCVAVQACSHKVLKQLDGVFESPMIFQDLCMGCQDCIEACPLDAVYMKHIGS